MKWGRFIAISNRKPSFLLFQQYFCRKWTMSHIVEQEDGSRGSQLRPSSIIKDLGSCIHLHWQSQRIKLIHSLLLSWSQDRCLVPAFTSQHDKVLGNRKGQSLHIYSSYSEEGFPIKPLIKNPSCFLGWKCLTCHAQISYWQEEWDHHHSGDYWLSTQIYSPLFYNKKSLNQACWQHFWW